MAVILSNFNHCNNGDAYITYVDVTGPASYTTGGELLIGAQQTLIMPQQGPGPLIAADFTKAQLIRPGVAYCVAGKVNSADKLYLVIESVRPDTQPGPCAIVLAVAPPGAGGHPVR